MDQIASLPLVDRLRECAAVWTELNAASLARLGRAVVNDGGFFTRLETQPQGTTTATLEKFARFLADPVNWPDGMVAEEALALAHVTGVSAGAQAASAGPDDEISPVAGSAAA